MTLELIERGPSTQCSCGPQGVQHRCPCSTWKLQLWYPLHLQYSWLWWCWYLMMGDNLLPNDSLLLIRGVTILTALLHLLLLLRSCPIMDNVGLLVVLKCGTLSLRLCTKQSWSQLISASVAPGNSMFSFILWFRIDSSYSKYQMVYDQCSYLSNNERINLI